MRILKELKKQFLKNFATEKYNKNLEEYYGKIKNINAKSYKDKDGFIIVASTNYPGIISYGRTDEEAKNNFKDAILTYFKIPYEYAEIKRIRRLGDEIPKNEVFEVATA